MHSIIFLRWCVCVCVHARVHAHAWEFSIAHDEDQKKYLLCYSLPWYLETAYLTKPKVRHLGNSRYSVFLSPPPVPTVPSLQVCVHPSICGFLRGHWGFELSLHACAVDAFSYWTISLSPLHKLLNCSGLQVVSHCWAFGCFCRLSDPISETRYISCYSHREYLWRGPSDVGSRFSLRSFRSGAKKLARGKTED